MKSSSTPKLKQSLWNSSPCSLSYVTPLIPQQRIQRFTINSIYQKDDLHKPKIIDQKGQPFFILKQFRKQIRQASRTSYQNCIKSNTQKPFKNIQKQTLNKESHNHSVHKLSFHLKQPLQKLQKQANNKKYSQLCLLNSNKQNLDNYCYKKTFKSFLKNQQKNNSIKQNIQNNGQQQLNLSKKFMIKKVKNRFLGQQKEQIKEKY